MLHEESAAVVLTRQPLPTLDRTKYGSADGVHRGAYILAGEESGKPDVILMSAGSEVHTMLEAHGMLKSQGFKVRSLSIPCLVSSSNSLTTTSRSCYQTSVG